MLDSEYHRKRNFAVTSEPREQKKRGGRQRLHSLRYVIQKHDARRLHYDFRLEFEGALKSWAIPKGPSLDPKDKRLAVHVEDHPLAYAEFEGSIPAGQYGGGEVIVWDQGIWQPYGDPVASYRSGKLKFSLTGEKLSGSWTLVRTHLRGGGDKEQWLLIKEDDESARSADDYDVVSALPKSVLTGKSIADSQLTKRDTVKPLKSVKAEKKNRIKDSADKVLSKGKLVSKDEISKKGTSVKKSAKANPPGTAPLPKHLAPELATLVDEPPDGEWLYEVKYDGYRILTRIENGRVSLLTRNDNDWTARMPQLVRALESLSLHDSWLDGEIVVLNDRGLPDFQALQQSFEIGRSIDILYYLFDAPFLNGEDLRQMPVEQRRARLESILPGTRGSPLRFSAAFTGDHRDIVASACAMSLEGLIGKRRGSPYTSRRSSDWIKLKCRLRQEFVIVGYTDPRGSRAGFGALLLGVYSGAGPIRELRYAGRVGTGFTDQNLRQLKAQLEGLARSQSPLATSLRGPQARGVHWLEPQLVAEVEFAEWTKDGIVRQAAFIALRDDKPASEIVHEIPGSPASAGKASSGKKSSKKQSTGKTSSEKATSEKTSSKKGGSQGASHAKGISGKTLATKGATVADVRISHPERVVDPLTGTTKIELVQFYADLSQWLLPHLKNRAVSLLRAPDGIEGEKFFQKHAENMAIPHMHHLPQALDPGHARLMEIDSLPALIGAAQMGTIELHTWGSSVSNIESPDRFVIDLDPDPALPWRSVVEAARLAFAILDELSLEAFLKTTGGKGLHLVVPLGRKNSWEEVKGFTKALAEFMTRQIPERFVAKMGPRNRIGKIFVDYLRNQRGASTVSAYSLRAKPGLPISVPIARGELDELRSSTDWHIGNLLERLSNLKVDPWVGYSNRQMLKPAMWQKLEAVPKIPQHSSGAGRPRSSRA